MIDHLDPTTFVRRPFEVQAVRVTVENIHQISEFTGDLVQPENPERLPYIQVDLRKVKNRIKIRVGQWVTFNPKSGTVQVYKDEAFHAQFKELTDDISAWVTFMQPKEDEEG